MRTDIARADPDLSERDCEGERALAAACESTLPGVYGLEYDLDVYYRDENNLTAPAYDPGRGHLTVLLRAAVPGVCSEDSANTASLRVCALRFPPLYHAADGSVHQLSIADEAWDAPAGPRQQAQLRASGSAPNDPLRFDAVSVLLGIELSELDAPWPAFDATPHFECATGRSGAACFADHDSDEEPGMTVELRHSGPPLQAPYPGCDGWRFAGLDTQAFPDWPHATQLYLGLRTALRGSFALEPDCEGGTGAAEADDIELRVLDCVLEDGARCNAPQATFVDQSIPTFHVLRAGEAPPDDSAFAGSESRGGRLRVVRLAELDHAVSCGDVRDAFPSEED